MIITAILEHWGGSDWRIWFSCCGFFQSCHGNPANKVIGFIFDLDPAIRVTVDMDQYVPRLDSEFITTIRFVDAHCFVCLLGICEKWKYKVL